MSMNMHPGTVLEPKIAPRALKAADDQLRADGSGRALVLTSIDSVNLTSICPTLDDFGGRSDALGG